ncbi:hypothetical protein YJAMGPKP_CDS0101 [Staphylococcus phage PG-2021_46]|nr:hypothetical protein [Staphylococcus lugdunensis]MDU6254419.1 hypothetical protein [Staphylococcus warneri]
MKKMPTKEIKQQRNSILQSLKLNDYRDNPTDEILQKRLNKRRQRQKVLKGLENKYDFDNNVNKNKRKNTTQYDISNKSINALKNKYKHLYEAKKQMEKCVDSIDSNKVPFSKKIIKEIYHTIETENMNGCDMYNMIHALQYQLKLHKKEKIERKQENIKNHFDSLGGIQLYLRLKNYLTDIGVDVYELH